MRIASLVAAIALAASWSATANATVTGLNQAGFTVQETAHIAAPPAKVWETLLRPGGWWNPEHSYSHDANNMAIVPIAGSCWCEKWAGGSVEHMRVVYVSPGKVLRMRGGLGPLQEMGVEGSMTWTLRPAIDGGTDVTVDYAVGGFSQRGFAGLAPGVDGVLAEQLNRMQMFLQTGNPVATATQ